MTMAFRLPADVLKSAQTGQLPKSLLTLALTTGDMAPYHEWLEGGGKVGQEVSYQPGRELLQDFTGVPVAADLAAIRHAVARFGGDASKVEPLNRVDLVIDHSVGVDHYGTVSALALNAELEMTRNAERYQLLKWSAGAYRQFGVVPPGNGICHQVNIENFSNVAGETDGVWAPDTVVGTDSHTTMGGGLGSLMWGVGGLEAEANMLAQPTGMNIPEVVGVHVTGKLPTGVTAMDLTLYVVAMLREHGVVSKFVEFYGKGLASMTAGDRCTIANMAPEYGATCGYFPIDDQTLAYLRETGREDESVRQFAQATGLWGGADSDTLFSSTVPLNLSQIRPAMSGPILPKQHTPLTDMKALALETFGAADGPEGELQNGDVVIAAITSCTNTSNAMGMMMAGLVAKKAAERGGKAQPWVKTSFGPGSKTVADYLMAAALQQHLDAIGFNIVGFGCTTCIGQSGPLEDAILEAIHDRELKVGAVLSGNRNFKGRVHKETKGQFLATPYLVLLYALKGTLHWDPLTEPVFNDADGNPVMMEDLMPSEAELTEAMSHVKAEMFVENRKALTTGSPAWDALEVATGSTFKFDPTSTYVQRPPFMDGMTLEMPGVSAKINNARILVLAGDGVTTDDISPAGKFGIDTPAGRYLAGLQVMEEDLNVLGARRGNHHVMGRATFGNPQFVNQTLKDGTKGAYTMHWPSGQRMEMFEAAEAYREAETPLVIFGGKEYGQGSSRDWAAKGVWMLGVQAVVVESMERIHRSNLIAMGIQPIILEEGVTMETLNLKGDEVITITPKDEIGIGAEMIIHINDNGEHRYIGGTLAVDTQAEMDQMNHGGILPLTVRNILADQGITANAA